MAEHTILCVLGNLGLVSDDSASDTRRCLPKESGYSADFSENTFPGVQANEAPIEYIIEQGAISGKPVTDVVYLCPPEGMESHIPSEAVSERLDSHSVFEELSTEGFLIERVDQFCANRGYDLPCFTPIPYDPSKPANSITSILDSLSKESTVSIDITGGQRDAALLLSIAANILKSGYGSICIGEIVYANYKDKKIYRQNNTFDLIDLVNAISAFVEYGRADQLDDFFGEKKKWTSPETKALVREMNAFSDMMSLCQIDHIDRQVRVIHEAIDNVTLTLEERRRIYSLFSDAIDQIEKPSWLYELGFDDSIDLLAKVDSRITSDIRKLPTSELREKLSSWQWDYVIERNELIFLYMLPSIKEMFIPNSPDEGDLILAILKWSLTHKMTQQALCIYRELIGHYLIEKGYFETTGAFLGLSESEKIEETTNVCLNCSIDRDGVSIHASGDYKKENPYFRIPVSKQNRLRKNVAWFKYLHATRNAIMHVGGDRGSFAYFFSTELLSIDRDETPSLEAITADMLDAIADIESPPEVSDELWNECRRLARRDQNRYRQRKNDGSIGLDQSDYAMNNSNASVLGDMLDDETLAKLNKLKQG